MRKIRIVISVIFMVLFFPLSVFAYIEPEPPSLEGQTMWERNPMLFPMLLTAGIIVVVALIWLAKPRGKEKVIIKETREREIIHPAKKKRYCGNCGEEITEPLNYCPECGTKLKVA